jgi:UDP-N-acetylglucosamine:LPS N-acetylglucosamine transferase
MEEDDISVPGFVDKTSEIAFDPAALNKLSEAAKAFSRPDAASKIAEKLLGLANG